MAWYRCEAQGEPADGHFAVTRFVEAEAPEAAVVRVRKTVGRELVRLGADPLNAEGYVSVNTVLRIDEEEVPGIAPDMDWTPKAA
jgi:hypothetical protein